MTDLADNLSIASNAVIENVVGGSGDDIIVGNNADNEISGGQGFDTLTGLEGDDIFIFYKSELDNTRFDTITDFVSGSDKIKLVIDQQTHVAPQFKKGKYP